jgi:hypothetical protein
MLDMQALCPTVHSFHYEGKQVKGLGKTGGVKLQLMVREEWFALCFGKLKEEENKRK